MKKVLFWTAITVSCLWVSCKDDKKPDDVYKPAVEFQDCNVWLNGIHFTKMINDADRQITEKDGIIYFTSPENTDLFNDPDEGKLTQATAKILFAEVDNNKPFTFQARIKPGFTPGGLYHQGSIVVMANDTLYQKFCFEQDERGKHRVVTVRTIGTSDDNNHEVMTQDYIYYKISSDTKTIASYYSMDGKEWQLVRLYRNSYPKDLKVGISSMAPQKDVCVSEFSELRLTTNTVEDFRMGD